MKTITFDVDSLQKMCETLKEFETKFGVEPLDDVLSVDELCSDASYSDSTFDPRDDTEDRAYYLCKKSGFRIEGDTLLHGDEVWDPVQKDFVVMSSSMRTYVGTIDTNTGYRNVKVMTNNCTKSYDLDPCFDLIKHSPCGFAWGYHGSGPAQLALALLCDHLVHHPEDEDFVKQIYVVFGPPGQMTVELSPSDRVLGIHQEFKRFFVSTLPQDEQFVITSVKLHEILERMAKACQRTQT